MNVLVVGGGGREHALCWTLAKQATVFCAPGNPGIRDCATILPIPVDDHTRLLDAAEEYNIDLVVVGPEAPLAEGLVDRLEKAGRPAFGPTQKAAQLEASKAFAKDIMEKAGVPTATTKIFTDLTMATSYIETHEEPLVVKASGLAAGKGAVVCATRHEALRAAEAMFGGKFGDAGNSVLVEDFMEGEELSVLAITDGERFSILPPSQDHKRLLEGDKGPNTGGMGAYAPVSLSTDDLLARIGREVLQPTLHAMNEIGSPYKGVLYAGLMITPNGDPKVVEFNCRFGDPEAQVVLPLAGDRLLEDLVTIANGEPWQPEEIVKPTQAAVTTVLAAPGYPDQPKKGATIELPPDPIEDTVLFHAGTKMSGNDLVVSGGRVLCATGFGDTVNEALAKSQKLADSVSFDGKVYRRDIGWREIERAGAA
ncbi:MAG: phosphoribosylamine--glycine ligase [Gemmatimonadota bacterium]|nr:phosphoribosylamine--glycine ligase [Gemmatimonadota bacterium]